MAATATAPGNLDHRPGRPPAPPFRAASLAEGHAGIALLFAELAARDGTPRHRATAHAHLTAATAHLASSPDQGLYHGAAAVAFAAATARRTTDDYAVLLSRLDRRVSAALGRTLAAEEERMRSGRPGTSARSYDVVSGATGLGRYLLLRGEPHRALLTRTLSCLVRMTEPVTAHGRRVPGWWVPHGTDGPFSHVFPRGHFDVGLAHGVPGPLALLALAHRAGVRVPGQDTAITGIADWLLRRRTPAAPWPPVIGFDQHTSRTTRPPPGRTAWCYGTPGVARALYLAGRALDRPDWCTAALRALTEALAAPGELVDSALCHGWAGVLHVTWLMAHDSGNPQLAGSLPWLAEKVLNDYDADAPFGYRYRSPGQQAAIDRAGFLQGAAGIALALDAYARNLPPTTRWDAALLLT
ncbi:hypothetical protein GCM10018772_22180 [Streptomyces fumanus]|uniref:Lanthionine synthetase n=1 Tax=Streptomyces fumanus TaxID=67302 RepID=A0A919ABR1_9ACTN|nr:hypothetical protein GCM10018772_22180 [Streptomyces fumanus]